MEQARFSEALDDAANIGELLRKIRTQEHLTLTALAKQIGFSAANLCDLEQGRKMPGFRRAMVIAERLELPKAKVLELLVQQLFRRERLDYDISVGERGPSMQVSITEPVEEPLVVQ